MIYPEITWRLEWCFDATGLSINNTVYILPTADLWVLAVMNAPIIWWNSWRTAQHGKDEALRYIREFVQDLPIPKPTDAARARVEALVKELIDLKGGRTAGLRAMIEWLQTEIGIEKVSNKLRDLIGLPLEEMLAEIKKQLPKKKGLSAADLQRIKAEHATTVVPLQANARCADQHEREVSDLVNEAFALTPAEIKLMWDTAPPRMPFTAP